MIGLTANNKTSESTSMMHVFILSLGTFIIFFQGFMVAPLLPMLSEYFHTSVRHVSFIEPSYLLGYGLFTLIYASLSDRFGRFRIISFSMILFVVFTALTALVDGINQMILLRFLTGAGAAGVAPTIISWIGDTYPYEKRGHALGIFFGAMAGGTAFGASAGALLTSIIGWRVLFIGVAFVGALVLLTILYFRKQVFSKDVPTKSDEHIFVSYRNILLMKRARVTYFYVLFNAMFHSGIFAWLGYYFYKNYALNEAQIGFAMLGYGVPGLLLGPLLGKLADRYGRNRIIPIGIAVSAFAVFLLSQNLSLTLSNVLVALLSLGFDLSHPLFAAIVTTFSKRKGAATGLFAFFLFLGYGLGSLLLSLIVHIGLEKSFQIYGIAAFIGAIVAIFAFRKER